MFITIVLGIIIVLEIFLLWKCYCTHPRIILPDLKLQQKGNPDKIIWSYWHDQNLPQTIKLALFSWQHFHPDWTIYLITSETLPSFLTLSDFPQSFSSQSHAHQSDIIRILLLEKYGGIWMDASIILQQRIDSKWFPQDYDVGGFYISNFTTDQNFKVFENWFIAAPRNSPLIRAWKHEFFRALEFHNRSDYIAQLEAENLPIGKIISKEYLMMHCCFIKILKNHPNKFRIRQIEVGDPQNGPFYYLTNNKWDIEKSTQALVDSDSTFQYRQPIIKLRGNDRSALEKKLKHAHPKSVIGKIINKISDRS